ncbi:MAG: MFS transporter [Bacteroidota bacterium]
MAHTLAAGLQIRLGFYPVQIITLTGGGVLFIVLGLMKTFPLICLFTFLLSFVNEAFRPANSTAIASYSKDENRTRSYSLNRLAINLGWATGSALGGILAKHSYQLLFWVDGFTNITAALFMWFFLKPSKRAVILNKDNTATIKRSAYKGQDVPVVHFACYIIRLLFLPDFYQYAGIL